MLKSMDASSIKGLRKKRLNLKKAVFGCKRRVSQRAISGRVKEMRFRFT